MSKTIVKLTDNRYLDATYVHKDIIKVFISSTQSLTANAVTTVAFDSEAFNLGTKLSLDDNGVLIGSGVKYVRVSGQVYLNGGTDGVKNLFIYKNSTQQSRALLRPTLTYNSIYTSVIFAVDEGDYIYLKVQPQTNDDSLASDQRTTFMIVEVLD